MRRDPVDDRKVLTMENVEDYKHALDVSAIVAITDQKGTIIHVNDNFCRISKYNPEELIGQDHRIINSGYHPEEFIKGLWKTIASGKVWKGEMRNRAKDGTIYWVDTTIVPFLKSDGKPYQYVAIRSDITERKNSEEHIKKINEQAVGHTRELEYKNRQLVDFCNIVSHNLRAPLINISMLVDYLEQCIDEADRMEVQGKIRPVVDHLLEIFNELVESVQVRQDGGIKADNIHLQECLERILVGFAPQSREYGAEITSEFGVPVVRFPRKYMESIFSNLISNALKYRHPERAPRIEVQSRKTDRGILLSVADNGLGIDLQRHREHLFKIRKTFHRHVDAKGLGLFMTKTQVEAMGGKIWAESTPGKGSVFFVEIKKKDHEEH
jgi:PAS domain S-box-containing protein